AKQYQYRVASLLKEFRIKRIDYSFRLLLSITARGILLKIIRLKPILYFITLLVSLTSFSQSDQCEFPKLWKVDLTKVIATQVVKNENGERISDTLDIDRFVGKYKLPDSVIFNEGKASVFFYKNEEVQKEEGSYKLSDKNFSFKAKGTSLTTVKYKFKKDNASCKLVEDGINFTTIIKGDDQNFVWIRYYLIPKS
ncbi:MAG: hypothetical protein RLP12_09320, partial [Ekhidna sp.]